MKKIYQRVMAVALAGTTLLGAGLWHKHHRTGPAPSRPVAQNTGALPTGVSEATWADIRNALEKQEYHISFDDQKKKLQSPNRRNNIRAYYEPGKLTVQTRVDTTGQGFKMQLVNEGIFADGKLLYVPEVTARVEHHENKVQISHSAFTEEFINNEAGVRQNFIVESAPEGTRQLQVKMTAKGLKVEQGSGNELRFYSETSDGQTRNELVYSDLKCWDADKKPLNATLAYVDNRIQISVDVAGASYPVTIDPIIANGTPQNANKILEIHQSYMHLGFSVSSAGDVNGDGYSDVIVGAPDYDYTKDAEGGAFVYKGDPSGLTLTAVTFKSNQIGAKMGYSVASAGDFNGDGFSDVIVGIPFYDKDAIDEGRANLYLGSSTFFTGPITAYGLASGEGGALMGITVATAGDIDKDGFSDILVGSPQASNGESKEGTVRYYMGNASGAPLSLKTLQVNQANAQFGYSLAPAGDVDADGYSDVIIGARWYSNGQGQEGEGAAFIYRGSSSGLQGNPVIIEGNQYNAAMGNKVSSAGDVNGDGYSDVLISAYLFDPDISKQTDRGIVQLYHGSSTGINPQQVARTFYGGDNDHMGSSIACAGDVNGDGYSDIILGAEYYDNGQFNEGAVFVYQGSKDGVVGDPAATMESNQADGWFGTAIASAGDVNGDGYSDILVGCYTFDNGQTDEGHVFVYHGGPEGIGTKDATSATNNKTGALMGFSLASAGDVDGDGYSDVVVGAPYYDNGESGEGVAFVYRGSINGLITNTYNLLEKNQANSFFGGSVAGPGDVNGDGYADIVIGAYNYSHDQESEGAVFIFYGSSSGITETGKVVIESNQPNISFGYSVWNNCDTNGDGYSDVLIGTLCSANYGAPEGEAHVYFGSQNGVNLASLIVIKGDKPGALIGNAVAGAGDLNDDGFDEIIIGAKSYEGRGAAFIFSGSQTGPVTISPQILKGDQDNAEMGYAVSSAGDVNGDGYDDIIIGSRLYDTDSPSSKNGIAQIFLGSLVGVTNQPSFILKDNLPRISSAAERFGCSVACAGDVNGDGYSDVIVGADFRDFSFSFEGGAFIFNGSSSGVSLNHSFYLTGGQHYVHMGQSVSGAGDVNGDGVSDVIIGVPNSDYNQNIKESGKALVLYGNASKTTILNNFRLYNTDLTTPINHTQFPQANFGAGLFAKSFTGRNKGKLVWETKPLAQGFSKGSNNRITNSTQSTNSQSVYSNLGTTGLELKNLIDKQGPGTKVRARVKYDPVLALTGQSYGPWRYLPAYLMGNSTAPVPEEEGNDLAENIEKKIIRSEEDKAPELATIYPNPVSNRLNIDFKDKDHVQSLRILTATGSVVYQSNELRSSVDVSKLSEGAYFLIITKTDGSLTTRQILIHR